MLQLGPRQQMVPLLLSSFTFFFYLKIIMCLRLEYSLSDRQSDEHTAAGRSGKKEEKYIIH